MKRTIPKLKNPKIIAFRVPAQEWQSAIEKNALEFMLLTIYSGFPRHVKQDLDNRRPDTDLYIATIWGQQTQIENVEDLTDHTTALRDLDRCCDTIKEHRLCDRQCTQCIVHHTITELEQTIRDALHD